MRPMHVGAAGADHSYAKGAGSIVVIDGTFGNRNLYDVSTADPEAGYFAAWMGLNLNPTHGFMHYDVSAGRIDAAFQGSTNSFADHFSQLSEQLRSLACRLAAT